MIWTVKSSLWLKTLGQILKKFGILLQKEGRVAMLAGSVARKKAARFIIDNAKGAEAAK